MKLLIITQKVDIDDPILGFFHRWIEEFSKYCEKLTVIALGVGEYKLPENVKILSLGKEGGVSKLKYIFNFYKYIWQERKNYDVVFVHMNPVYVILGGIFWKFWHKRIGLWYTHKNVDLKLRIAEKLVDVIFTSSKESFRIKSKKLMTVGHGIDSQYFKPINILLDKKDNFRILYVGRISKIKNQELLIRAIDFLVKEKKFNNLEVYLVGPIVTEEDIKYEAGLKKIINELDLTSYFFFKGKMSNRDILNYYREADLSINLCLTGGMDKAVLESMSCGLLVIVLNKAFSDLFSSYQNDLLLKQESAIELAEKIINLKNISIDKKIEIKKYLRDKIVSGFDLKNLILLLVKKLNNK